MFRRLPARGASWTLSIAFHVAVFLPFLLLSGVTSTPAAPDKSLSMRWRPGRAQGFVRDWVGDVVEETEAVAVAEPATIALDAALDDDVEAMNDLPFQESFGTSEVISDAPFDGPANNALIGVGGGAGGSFKGRGGSRNLATGGGGRRRGEGWRTSALSPHTMRLRVGEKDDLPLRALRTSLRVDGFRARVTLEATYRNDRGRTLEGTFQVRLPDGASPAVLGFGESVPDASRRAVAAPPQVAASLRDLPVVKEGLRFARFAGRETASRAYRETARRRVDPALLEWASAGVFDARVFPLVAGCDHRVVLAYDVDLQPVGDDLVHRLELPAGIPNLDVEISVQGLSAEVSPGAPHEDGRFRYHDPVERTFTVRVPRPRGFALTAEDAATGPVFAAYARPDLPAARTRPTRRAVFLVDASSSAGPDRFPIALDLLQRVLERNRPALEEFAVAFFHVETTWWRPGFVANSDENVRALRVDAADVALVGATDLARALDATATQPGEWDLFLLSDGSATWGQRDPAEVAARAPRGHAVFSYALGLSGTDSRLLDRLARESGGGTFAVGGPDALDAAAVAHASRPWRIEAVAVEGARDLVVEGRPVALHPGQPLRVVGRGALPADAALVLDVESGGVRHRLRTSLARRMPSDLALGAYARVVVDALEDAGGDLGDVARAYATHLGVVSASVSLVMLDTDEAYERYGIATEKEALAVKVSEPGRLVALAARAPARAVDPRAPFAAWVAGAPDDHPDARAFRALLAALPEEALQLSAAPPGCRARTWRELGDVRAVAAEPSQHGETVREAAEAALARLGPCDALRLLGSFVEESPSDGDVLRAVGYRALAWGRGRDAFALLRRAAEARPDVPQGWLATGAAAAAAGGADLAMLANEAALVAGRAAGRAAAREVVLVQHVDLLRRVVAREVASRAVPYAVERLAALEAQLPLREADLVATIAWSTDATDVDLHVVGPTGEDCFYSHTTTAEGGRITPDVTTGFGPEMFVLPASAGGEHVVKVVYYRSDDRRTSLRSEVLATVVEGWGRPGARATVRVVPLVTGRAEVEVLRSGGAPRGAPAGAVPEGASARVGSR